jgi:hypothetical protein
MALCQPGFHHSNFQKSKYIFMAHDLNVSLCDVCVHKLALEPTQGADLTMDTIYGWTMDYENFRKLPDSLKFDALKNADLVQIVNSRLSIVRNTPRGRIFSYFSY